MKTTTINYLPAFPAPAAISTFADDAQQHTIRWAGRIGLVTTPLTPDWLSKARFGWQAAREYPYAGYDEICLAGDLLTWLFTVDDLCDRASDHKENADELKQMLKGCMAILQKEKITTASPFNDGLRNIMARLNFISPPNFFNCFINQMLIYLRECFIEIRMQTKGYIPTIGEYWDLRAKTGFDIMFPLAGIFNDIRLPDEILEHRVVRKIERELSLIGCLANDLHSLRREEQLDAMGLNLVFVSQHELGISREEAIHMIITAHDNKIQQLQALREGLPYWGRHINAALDVYLDGLYQIIKGYYDWAMSDSGRYYY